MLSGIVLHDAPELFNGKGCPQTIETSSLTIDHILVSQNTQEYLVGTGQYVQNTTFISDHLTLLIQIEDRILSPTTCSSPKDSTPSAPEVYLEELCSQSTHNNIQTQLRELLECSSLLEKCHFPTRNDKAHKTPKSQEVLSSQGNSPSGIPLVEE